VIRIAGWRTENFLKRRSRKGQRFYANGRRPGRPWRERVAARPELFETVVFQSDGGTVQSSTWIDDGPTDVSPALSPGTYAVEIPPAGYRSATRQVRVDAGRTTDVALTLVPE